MYTELTAQTLQQICGVFRDFDNGRSWRRNAVGLR
jgi:hypothetical protein